MRARLFAYLSYSDAPGALDWLRALGFEVLVRQDDEAGRVLHSEARLGEVVVMVASSDADYGTLPLVGHSTGQGLYIHTDDVDELESRALEAGGSTVIAAQDTSWGSRRARVLDPEGREWSFGSYKPGSHEP